MRPKDRATRVLWELRKAIMAGDDETANKLSAILNEWSVGRDERRTSAYAKQEVTDFLGFLREDSPRSGE